MSRNLSATVAGATLFLIFTSILSKGIGFLREILFASRFGTSESYDLYLIAAVFPLILNTSLFYIGQNYFIPLYHKASSSNETREAVVRKNFWFFILWGVLLSAALIIFSDTLLNIYIGSSYSNHRELIKNIFNITSLTVPIGAGIAILSAFINAEFEFRIPAYSLLILNVFIVLIVFIYSEQLFVYSIPVGYFIGSFLQLVFLIIYVRFRKGISLKFSTKISGIKFKPDTLIISIIVIEILGQLYILIDRWFYPMVDPGGIAALNYAVNVFSLPVSLIAISFASVLFPFFSKSAVERNQDNYDSRLINSLKINNLIFLPVFIVLFFYGEDLVRIIYQRGRFSYSDTILTKEILRYLSFSILFYSGYAILNKSLFAVNKVKHLFFITLTAILLKLILSWILVKFYKQNGLALSTGLVYCYFFVCSLFVVLGTLKKTAGVLLHLIFYAGIAAFLFFIVKILSGLISVDTLSSGIFQIGGFCILFLAAVYLIDNSYIRSFNSFILKNLVNKN